jgi:hypothetical protein
MSSMDKKPNNKKPDKARPGSPAKPQSPGHPAPVVPRPER